MIHQKRGAESIGFFPGLPSQKRETTIQIITLDLLGGRGQIL